MGADAMSLEIFGELEQGSPEWLAARCGLVTASTVGQLITPKTVKPAVNDYSRGLTATLVAERITGHVEPMQMNQAMLRGTLDEPIARAHYAEHHAPVTEVGFMIRDFDGCKIGFSPDGLVGEVGLIEVKSRAQKKHLQTILANEPPLENMAQMQCGLLVSGREWCDYISWSGGMPMWVHRVTPDKKWFDAILDATKAFEESSAQMVAAYQLAVEGKPPTERVDHFAEIEFTL
jgi:hypothetical protein